MKSMNFDKHLLLLALLLSMVGCGDRNNVREQCPPADEPSSFGRTCTADGECDNYLVCSNNQCGWPAAMIGEVGGDTSQVRVEHDGALVGEVTVELARGDLARRRGLGARPCLQPGWGMLFVHPDEQELEYTVEEMRFAVDLAFADEDGVIVEVRSGLAPGSSELISSNVPAKFALEVRAGALGVRVGDRLIVELTDQSESSL
jgi:uncharacterized membrane protein (UPF0127 family)